MNKSHQTTYDRLIEKGVPENEAGIILREQIHKLGADYHGGLECTIYRRYHTKYSDPRDFLELFENGWTVDIVDSNVIYPAKTR